MPHPEKKRKMNQRDLAINGILLVCIAAVAYVLAVYRPVEVEDPDDRLAGRPEVERPVGPETRPGPDPSIERIAHASTLVQINPFRTIITPTPTPTPPPPTPKPRPPLGAVMAQYEIIMIDPSRGTVTVQPKQGGGDMIEFRVGQVRDLAFRNEALPVRLKSVDPNDFSATFTAPKTESPTSELDTVTLRFF